MTGVIERAGRKGAASDWSAKGASEGRLNSAEGDGPVMTRDTDHVSNFRRRARSPISTLAVSLLTLACSVGILTDTAFAGSRSTRELNAAAAAAGGQPIQHVESAVRAAADGQPVAPVPASVPRRRTALLTPQAAADVPVPEARPARRTTQVQTREQSTPRLQNAVLRGGVEQRQIQRVSALRGLNRRWSCVPFARELTGFQISGDAWRWWDAASGRYNRGRTPQAGAVIVLKRSGSMRRGHVAVVRRIVNSREIIVDQANWAPRGRINEPSRVIDVSRNNDWSQTRFWHQPTGQMGTTVNPTYGFIYPSASATQIAERVD